MNELQQLSLFTWLPFIEILLLFLLSRALFTRLAWFLQSFMKRQNWVYYLLAILFLPGTYIHELSHYIVAKFLFVKTFGMTLRPKIGKNTIRMGSVEIQSTDFIRRFLIGSAPFTVGVSLLVGSMYALVSNNWHTHPLFVFLEILFVFQVGNTMFMSKKDWEGTWKVLVLLIFTGIILYGIGFPTQWIFDSITNSEAFFKTASFYLAVPIGIDILAIILLSLFI